MLFKKYIDNCLQLSKPFKAIIIQSNIVLSFLFLQFVSIAQADPLLPLLGKYSVGFSQLQQTLLLKDRGNITCTIDIWYPTDSNGSERYTYKDYILMHPDSTAETTVRSLRLSFQDFFGNTTDSA
jgi:hypothetical protein